MKSVEYEAIIDGFAKPNGMCGYVRWYCSGSSQVILKNAETSLGQWPVRHRTIVLWGLRILFGLSDGLAGWIPIGLITHWRYCPELNILYHGKHLKK